jgi:butyryl-CoA dehydrogenase
MQCCLYADLENALEGEAKEKASLLLDLLIPVVKTYPAETSIRSTSQAIQIFGGYGYCEDFPVEQHFRDTRIHTIHEGTTGIQGIDILGRKVRMKNGKAFRLYLEEVGRAVEQARALEALRPYAERLAASTEELRRITAALIARGEEQGSRAMLADATLYLDYFSLVAIAWQWLLQAVTAAKALEANPTQDIRNFYQVKLLTARYFFHYELPKSLGLAQRLMEAEALTLTMENQMFSD